MSCNIPIQKGVKKAADCKCYGAVMRAYGGLIDAGEPEKTALEAAKIIYGYHHPEDSALTQALTVERWTNEKSLH
ncbi:MAG: hypothetical protein COB36_00180 [Alphaproteobacteria bacterium]|nr:MAG: hypothetical protein COB36_00180 [Alphaproteobacteria bacterium]